MNGGYYMINCKGLDLTKGETPQTITGLYSKMENALSRNKPIYAYNCAWGSLPVTPIEVFIIPLLENTIVATASTLQIWVTNEDVVTIQNMAPST